MSVSISVSVSVSVSMSMSVTVSVSMDRSVCMIVSDSARGERAVKWTLSFHKNENEMLRE